MLEVFDLERKRVAILENAYAIEENKKLNSLWYLKFSLPEGDPKNKFCNTFWYVRYNDGELYRIMPRTFVSSETGSYSYECEHVLATLLDKIMFGFVAVGNLGVYTRDCINYVLNRQTEKNWVLGECEFSRQFEYGWENENLLSALFSIATPFTEQYMWVTDTKKYPWTINLKRIPDGKPECYVVLRRNLLSYQTSDYPENICTRLYPLGYGEGVNQLGISEINNGIPYLQSPKEITDKYGIIERVWTDRRYENVESLMSAAQKMLDELQEPVIQYDIGYQEIDEQDYEKVDIGKRVQIRYEDDVVNTIVTELNTVFDEIPSSTMTVANRSVDIASTVADLADRQRIESTYAQGATQLYAQSLQANCDSKSGAIMSFYIPSEMRIVNSVKLKIKTESFRAYSKTTSTRETSNQTSSAGGGGTTTSEGGGGTTRNTGDSGVEVEWGTTYTFEAQGHTHPFERVVAHKHEIELPDHTHSIDLPAHTHSVNIPSHAHDISPGIYRFGSPKTMSIYVNGVLRTNVESTNTELDITEYLVDERSGTIPRGTWHDIEVRPNDLAYVMIDMFIQGFVQSRGDATV